MANSQLTTILLLVAVGAVIYYISQPSVGEANVETVDNVQEQPVEENEEEVVEEEQEAKEAEEPKEEEKEEKVQVPELDSSELTGMSASSNGASLDSAFTGAVPPSTATDQVDFNRNNVSEYDSSQFLPQEVNDEWFDTDFTKAKYNLNDDKMINTNRYIIGVNTVGQSLKNPSYDIRGTIPNPKYTVSPWMNSTYEPDNNLKPLC